MIQIIQLPLRKIKGKSMKRVFVEECVVCLSKDIKQLDQIKDHSISGDEFFLAECNSCGFRFTQNPPTEENCGPYYQSEEYISHSDTSSGFIFKVYHWVRNIMLGIKSNLLIQLNAKKSLLDIGSGTGYFLDHMQKKGFEISGIEIDDTARNYSTEKFNIEVNHPSVLREGKIDKKFGYITLWHVLEHLYQPDDYWNNFFKLLDDDGFLIIAVPNFKSYDASHYGTFWAAYDVPRHLWHFNPSTLQRMAERNNFELINKKMMYFDPFYNAMLSEKYKKTSFGLIRGGVIGMISLLNGLLDVNKASSVIYILKKKK